jgi:hypothetical protein
MGADAASAFLIGRLTQEGRTARAILKASTPGPLRGLGGVHVFAVDGDRLWLVQPQLLGDPSIASVQLTDVDGARVRMGRRLEVELRLGGRVMRFAVLDDAAAAERFVAALDGGALPTE